MVFHKIPKFQDIGVLLIGSAISQSSYRYSNRATQISAFPISLILVGPLGT